MVIDLARAWHGCVATSILEVLRRHGHLQKVVNSAVFFRASSSGKRRSLRRRSWRRSWASHHSNFTWVCSGYALNGGYKKKKQTGQQLESLRTYEFFSHGHLWIIHGDHICSLVVLSFCVQMVGCFLEPVPSHKVTVFLDVLSSLISSNTSQATVQVRSSFSYIRIVGNVSHDCWENYIVFWALLYTHVLEKPLWKPWKKWQSNTASPSREVNDQNHYISGCFILDLLYRWVYFPGDARLGESTWGAAPQRCFWVYKPHQL